MSKGINISFPFKETSLGGIFETNKTTQEAVKSDLISLLTTRRGQRPMRANLYSPIYDYIMEPMDDFMKSELRKDIEEKVDEFIPQIKIKRITFSPQEDLNLLTISIIFEIENFFGVEDSIVLNIPTEINV
jgi:phage baseplate assembly protein W